MYIYIYTYNNNKENIYTLLSVLFRHVLFICFIYMCNPLLGISMCSDMRYSYVLSICVIPCLGFLCVFRYALFICVVYMCNPLFGTSICAQICRTPAFLHVMYVCMFVLFVFIAFVYTWVGSA